MSILADAESTKRTVIFQKVRRIMPIDQLVDTRPEKAEKPHGYQDSYIGLFNDGSGGAHT